MVWPRSTRRMRATVIVAGIVACVGASQVLGAPTASSAGSVTPTVRSTTSPKLPATATARPATATARPTVTSTPVKRQGPFAVVLVVDAARYDEFNLKLMPNLAALVAHGASYPFAWVGQLPSVTETSHATIGTGVLPRRHLVLGDTWRVPGTNSMAPSLLDGNLVRSGYIGKFIQQSKVPSLGAIVRARYPGSLVVSLSGHKAYAADSMGAGTADFVAFGGKDSRGHYVPGGEPGHVPAESILKSTQLDLPAYPRTPGLEDGWVTTLALKFLFKYHPRLLMVNLPEVDAGGHAAGTQASVMQPLMDSVDHQIGRIVAAYQRAGMYDQTYFVITSDHGMVPAAHTISSQQIEATVRKAGGQPLYMGHGDDCTIWLKNPSAAPAVAAALSKANIRNVAGVYMRSPGGGYRLVSPPSRFADPAAATAYTHLLSTFDSAEAPDLALIYDENTMTMKPLYQQIGRKGDHGGATWGAQHIGMFLSGPGIRQGYSSNYPARLVDVAPTVEMLLGARPRGQDGAPLADALTHPPSWATPLQSSQRPALASDVAALMHEAALRPNR